jgi:hypothetical protein
MMERVDAVEKIIEHLSNLNKIKKCATDSIRDCDFVSSIDCIHKFHTATGAVSAAIIMFRGVLEDEEIVRYHTTLNKISEEFRAETIEMAKKCRCFTD